MSSYVRLDRGNLIRSLEHMRGEMLVSAVMQIIEGGDFDADDIITLYDLMGREIERLKAREETCGRSQEL